MEEMQAELDGLESELAMKDKDISWLETEHYGTPIEWPDDIAEKYKPEAFKANVRRVVEECKPREQLVGFNCDEPMCFATFRKPDEDWGRYDSWYFECAAWTELYGDAVSMAGAKAECSDGSEEGLLFLGPVWGDLPEDDAARDNFYKRLKTRWDKVEREWVCEGESSYLE